MHRERKRGGKQRWWGEWIKRCKTFIPISKYTVALCTKKSSLQSSRHVLLLPPVWCSWLKPQVNQQHLRQRDNNAFHIQHTTNAPFSPLSLVYISLLLHRSIFISAQPLFFSSSDAPCIWIFLVSSLPSCLSRWACYPLAFGSLVFKQNVNKVLPEGTDAGLKGANSSVGGCKPCEGSRVLAGEAGVCAGCGRRSGGQRKGDNSVETPVLF